MGSLDGSIILFFLLHTIFPSSTPYRISSLSASAPSSRHSHASHAVSVLLRGSIREGKLLHGRSDRAMHHTRNGTWGDYSKIGLTDTPLQHVNNKTVIGIIQKKPSVSIVKWSLTSRKEFIKTKWNWKKMLSRFKSPLTTVSPWEVVLLGEWMIPLEEDELLDEDQRCPHQRELRLKIGGKVIGFTETQWNHPMLTW